MKIKSREEIFFESTGRYSKAALENCDKHPVEYIEFARQWAKNPTSVFLCGGYGRGKTHFAFAMIRELFRNWASIWPRYFTSPELDSRLLKASKSDCGDQEEVKSMSQEDVLFIDDLGRESKSDRLKRQYFEILNYRYVHQLPTLISSNFALQELGDILEGSIASRMQEWQIIEFNGSDLRKDSGLSIATTNHLNGPKIDQTMLFGGVVA